MFKFLTLSRTNTLLLVLIILINAYVVVTPFLPAMIFWTKSHNSAEVEHLSQQVNSPPTLKPIPGPNRLIIPAMVFDQKVYESNDSTFANIVNVLKKGVWHWPESSTPDKGGNTVMLGHRFTYTNPRGVFYYLDKVKVGKEIAVIWNHKKYVYKVVSTKVVSPSDTSILKNTKQPQLTLYTCTPIWWPKNRLVVTARLETNL